MTGRHSLCKGLLLCKVFQARTKEDTQEESRKLNVPIQKFLSADTSLRLAA